MQTLNDVKNSLLALGLKQGIDLSDPEIADAFDTEIGSVRWFQNYSIHDNWDNKLQESLRYCLYYIHKHQTALEKGDLKAAGSALSMARMYSMSLYQLFDAIQTDISTLLSGKYKTNDFSWTQLDDEKTDNLNQTPKMINK